MAAETPLVAVNGVLGASVSSLDRGFIYGDGLFETCRLHQGEPLLWALHVQRLSLGAERLGIPLNLEQLESQRRQIQIAAAQDWPLNGVLKVILTRGQGGRGYAPPTDPSPSLCWQFFPGIKASWADNALRGIQLRVCDRQLPENPDLAGLKHLNRLDYVLARSEWANEYPEGLLLDRQGHVIEGTLSNLFAWVDDQLCTPALEVAGVAGVMRRFIMDTLAPQLGISVVERSLTMEDLARARELFMCNSVFGIWPVIRLVPNGLDYPIGSVSLKLQSAWQAFIASHATAGENR